MKRQSKILLVILLAILVLFAGRSQAQNKSRYIVTIRGPVGNAVRGAGGEVIHEYHIIPGIAIEIPEAALPGLARNPNVVSIEPDAEVWALPNTNKTPPGQAKKPSPPSPPAPPPEKIPWGVDRIDAELAWDKGFTGSESNVAVIDTGIDNDHPDLGVSGGVNFVRIGRRVNPSAWNDDNGHGTHVAGIIAARDNDIGVVGVAPDASLYAVKVLDSRGSGYYSDIIAGLQWCIDSDAPIHVVNMSLGGTFDSAAMESACIAARGNGILLVAAAGNSGGDVIYPAAYESVIAVAATDSSDVRASWSCYGNEIDIAAPGVNIYSTYPGGGYTTMSGTSMASPHVAGTLALSLDVDILLITADDLGDDGWDVYYGYGLVDAEEAATSDQANP